VFSHDISGGGSILRVDFSENRTKR